MGVLDDAIREHLELKRQHGVSEEELRRQEEEALGPARREVAPAASAEDADSAEGAEAAEPTAVEDEALEPVEADAPEADAPEADAPEPVETDTPEPMEAEAPETSEVEGTAVELPAEEPHAAAPFDAETEVVPSREEEPAEEEPAEEEPADEEPLRDFEQLDEDEDGEPAAEETGDADVLEDTPDFLQETPEHDRLWFEQKPPRDFDFD